MIKYDINELAARFENKAELFYELWEILSPQPRTEWFPEEKTVYDAWSFDSTFGNGINDMLINENYETVANGFQALRTLDVPRISEFVDALEAVFQKYSIQCESGDSIARMVSLPEDSRNALSGELAHAEKPFLDDIWDAGIIIHATWDFMLRNMQAFERRKA